MRVETKLVVDELISIMRAKLHHKTPYICPVCRLGKMSVHQKIAKCAYAKCNFTFYREFLGKMMTEHQVLELLKTGKSPLIRGFRSKKGELFDAHVVFKGGRAHFVFPSKKEKRVEDEKDAF